MIKFLYQRTYCDGRELGVVSGSLVINSKVWALADKLAIPELQDFAKKRYEEMLSAEWENKKPDLEDNLEARAVPLNLLLQEFSPPRPKDGQ